jgi:hypothetical protein
MTAAQQALYSARPSWNVAATGVAVLLGAVGCIGLILRKKWSTWALILSLGGVIAQDLWLFALSGAVSQAGAAAFVTQGMVAVISVGLVALARRASVQGWLS